MTGSTALVSASGLTLTVRHDTVWRDLSFDFGAGLNVVSGPSGSGRSSLLLALTGRMSGLSGQLQVAGQDGVRGARRVRAVTSVARVSTLITLESRLTVAESVTERALIDGLPTGRSVERITELEAVIGRTFGRARLIGELDAFDQTLLAAALACLRPSRLVVLDDADLDLTVDEQRRLFAALIELAGTGPAMVISTRELSAVPADTPTLSLPDPRAPDQAAPTPQAPQPTNPEAPDPSSPDPRPEST